jgi:hypothetical protein
LECEAPGEAVREETLAEKELRHWKFFFTAKNRSFEQVLNFKAGLVMQKKLHLL